MESEDDSRQERIYKDIVNFRMILTKLHLMMMM